MQFASASGLNAFKVEASSCSRLLHVATKYLIGYRYECDGWKIRPITFQFSSYGLFP